MVLRLCSCWLAGCNSGVTAATTPVAVLTVACCLAPALHPLNHIMILRHSSPLREGHCAEQGRTCSAHLAAIAP